MRFARRFLFLLLLVSWCSAAPAGAQTIIGNLPASGEPGGGTMTSSNHRAVSFTMASTSYSLTSALLRLQVIGTAPIPVVEIRADDGGLNPGNAVVASFTNPVFGTSSISTYAFTPTAPTTLLANTKYWLYVRGATTNSFLWAQSNPSAMPTSSGAATFGAYRSTLNAGSVWSASTAFNNFELQGSPIVDGTDVVPEPSAVVLFLPVLGLLTLQRRRRG